MIRNLSSKLFITIALAAIGHLSYAQQNRLAKNEIGLMLGGSNYHGDLAYQIVWDETNVAAGIFTRTNLTAYWSWRNSLMYGKISGSDANFKEYRLRNLSFYSHIWELSSIMEFNYVPFGTNVLTEDFTTFLFIGVAAYRFNPLADYNGETYQLRELNTEGQTSKEQYSTIQIAMPFGGGVKYSISKNWVFGWDVGWRKTWTDYLDDVSTTYPDLVEQRDRFGNLSAQMSDRSFEVTEDGQQIANAGDQRGDPNFNDFYFFTTFSLAYRFTPIVCWPKYRRGY